MNPRPQAFVRQIYMFSVLILNLTLYAAQTHASNRASTLESCPIPRCPVPSQLM